MISEKNDKKEKEFKMEIVWKNVIAFILLHYWGSRVFYHWDWTHFWFRKKN